MKIAILGAGAYGTALGGIMATNGYDVVYYDPMREPGRLSEVVNNARAMMLCVPSRAATHLLSHLPVDIPLIIATKGFLTEAPFAGFDDWAVVSGPGFADDIKQQKQLSLTVTDPRIQELLEASYIDFDRTDDRKGVLMCGALKNVYAIGAGLRGLKPGTAQHEQYLQDAADEMRAILLANGADPRTVDCNCGVGDLRITCYYPSRNYAYGQKLRNDPIAEPDQTVEGLAAIRRIKRHEITTPENLKVLKEILDATK